MEKEKSSKIYLIIIFILILCLVGVCIFAFTRENNSPSKCDSNDSANCGSNGNTVINNTNNLLDDATALENGKLLFDKASEFYLNTKLTANEFCGSANNQNDVVVDNYKYTLATKFTSINELKDYLKTFLSTNLVDKALDTNKFTEVDGKLYCLSEFDGGILSYYSGNKTMKVASITEDKITYSIEFVFIKNGGYDNCSVDVSNRAIDLSNCEKSDLISVPVDFVIERNDNKEWVVTKFADYYNIKAFDSENDITINYYE